MKINQYYIKGRIYQLKKMSLMNYLLKMIVLISKNNLKILILIHQKNKCF